MIDFSHTIPISKSMAHKTDRTHIDREYERRKRICEIRVPGAAVGGAQRSTSSYWHLTEQPIHRYWDAMTQATYTSHRERCSEIVSLRGYPATLRTHTMHPLNPNNVLETMSKTSHLQTPTRINQVLQQYCIMYTSKRGLCHVGTRKDADWKIGTAPFTSNEISSSTLPIAVIQLPRWTKLLLISK